MAKPDKTPKWQKQADHFAEVLAEMKEIQADPDSTPEEIAEATETVADMEKNLARLLSKHGVSPTV